jgi:hypothetical protein
MVFQFDKLCGNVDNLRDWKHESESAPMNGKIIITLFYLSLNCSFFCRSSGSAPTRCPNAGSGGRERQHRASMHCRRQSSSKNRMEANGTQRHRESGGDAAVPASGTPWLRHVHVWGPERGGSQRTHLRTNRRQVWVLHSESKLHTLLREIESYKIYDYFLQAEISENSIPDSFFFEHLILLASDYNNICVQTKCLNFQIVSSLSCVNLLT